ncbi:MAG: TrkH family potassium uptake protein [Phycisphaerae bacterium]|nr:TrkH family potassium uptake protein [Phycisphaerae bacterium]
MNYRQIFRQLGILIILVGSCMSTSLIWAILDRHNPNAIRHIIAIAISVFICLALGGIGLWIGRKADKLEGMYRKEAIAVVGLGWLICGLIGALPFLLSGVMTGACPDWTWYDRVASAIFESASGFTTTGASIFPSPESLPRAILFWRSLTHWLGGMGIVVLFVAILGQVGPGAKFLFTSEVPGPMSESIRPRIRQTAMLLWRIYLAISLAQVICLCLNGMDLFESFCHTFGTMATGGFSTRNASVGAYNSFGIELVIIIFMVLAGTNFNLYANILQGQWRQVFRNHELRAYLLILLVTTLLLTFDLTFHKVHAIGHSLRASAFQAVSIMTTTGFGSEDFDKWPTFSRWLLVTMMFIGGSAGSTGGGIKVIRILLFVRIAMLEIEQTFRPSVVRPLKINQHPLDDTVRRNIGVYIGLVLVITFLSTIILTILQHNDPEFDIETAFTAVIATINNIGPGLSMVGPTENFAFFSAPAKCFLTLLMILGRLEFMAILCLFVPAFWKRD